MKATFIFLALLAASPMFAGGRDQQVRQFVNDELAHHPEARLTDLYKNYFQDAFGPGHLIRNTASAGEYIDWELQQPGWSDTLAYQALGARHDYYRVNLLLVKNGTIPRDTLLMGMVASAGLSRNPDMGSWKKEWNEALRTIKQMGLRIPNLKADETLIAQRLGRGEPAIHHSKQYETVYHPHYRIIHRSIFERWREKYFR